MSEDEKIDIIKTGFRLKNDEKISFLLTILIFFFMLI